MSAATRVGGEVDAFCNRCKLTLAHTVLAMVGSKVVRVQCNTCRGQHTFRGASAPSAAPKSGGTRAPRASGGGEAKPSKTVTSFEALLSEKDLSQARPYSPRTAYKPEDVLQHPTFGYGIVSAVRADKVDVTFKFYEKTLVHGRGEAPAARPSFQAAHGAAGPTGVEADPPDTDGEPAEPSAG